MEICDLGVLMSEGNMLMALWSNSLRGSKLFEYLKLPVPLEARGSFREVLSFSVSPLCVQEV